MRYSKKQAIKDFRALWRWLSDNPEKGKEDWPEWEGNGGTVIEDFWSCPLCRYALNKCSGYVYERCKLCLIEWDFKTCCSNGALFSRWKKTKTLKTRAKLAKQISELPKK